MIVIKLGSKEQKSGVMKNKRKLKKRKKKLMEVRREKKRE